MRSKPIKFRNKNLLIPRWGSSSLSSSVSSFTASSFVSDILHLLCVHRPSRKPWGHVCFIQMFKKLRLQIRSLLLPVLLESLPCILLVVEVNVVDMILCTRQKLESNRKALVLQWQKEVLMHELTEIIPQRPHTRWLASAYFSMLCSRFSTSSASGSSPAR